MYVEIILIRVFPKYPLQIIFGEKGPKNIKKFHPKFHGFYVVE